MSYAHPSPPTIQTVFFHQIVGDGFEPARGGTVDLAKPFSKVDDAGALLGDVVLSVLGSVEEGFHQLHVHFGRQRLGEVARLGAVLVERDAHPETELRVVFEQRIGPAWATSVRVDRVGGSGEVAPKDRAATRGVGDEQPVANELGEELDVRRLTAPRASSRELEQGLEELAVLHVQFHATALEVGQRLEERPALSVPFAVA